MSETCELCAICHECPPHEDNSICWQCWQEELAGYLGEVFDEDRDD